MVEKIYCIYDRESKQVLKPLIVQRNDTAPIREFEQLANNNETIFHKYPADFALLEIGAIDMETMEIITSGPRHIHTALELLDNKQ